MPTQIAIPDVKDYGSLERYLSEADDRKLLVAIAMRSAVRVLPFVARADGARRYDQLTTATLRATLISWVAAKFPTHEMSFAAAAAARAAAAAARAAAAADDAAAAAAAAAIWAQIRVDLALAEANGSEALLASPLWQDEKASFLEGELRQSLDLDGAIPSEISRQITAFESSLKNLVPDETPTAHWPLWMDWLNHVLDPTKHRPKYFTDENVKKLIDQDSDTFWGFDRTKEKDARWTRDPQDVMADICALVSWKLGDESREEFDQQKIRSIFEQAKQPGYQVNVTFQQPRIFDLDPDKQIIEPDDAEEIADAREHLLECINELHKELYPKGRSNNRVDEFLETLSALKEEAEKDNYRETRLDRRFSKVIAKFQRNPFSDYDTGLAASDDQQFFDSQIKPLYEQLFRAEHGLLSLSTKGHSLAERMFPPASQRELADLSGAFKSMLNEIAQHNDYIGVNFANLMKMVVEEQEKNLKDPYIGAAGLAVSAGFLRGAYTSMKTALVSGLLFEGMQDVAEFLRSFLPNFDQISETGGNQMRALWQAVNKLLSKENGSSNDKDDDDPTDGHIDI